eukprot:GHVU01008172.1.p1 GENE.GHVU01008172.1~~GHVU01008172.1.p1  ORF type:complete len:108 (+),score=10.46 GHVU01008172.1:586-909(+)
MDRPLRSCTCDRAGACNADTGAVVTFNYDFPGLIKELDVAKIVIDINNSLSCEDDFTVKFSVGPLKGLCDPHTDSNAQEISLEVRRFRQTHHIRIIRCKLPAAVRAG